MTIDETNNNQNSKGLYDQKEQLDSVSMVCESQPVYGTVKKQGEYTIEDYLAIPDDRRVELIDGVIYDMSSPTAIHQEILIELATILKNYIHSKNGKCKTYVSAFDVQLDCDEKTIVQPDVMIICDRNKVHLQRVFGAPDFIVEILSPSTDKKDSYLKLYKYANAGVREYWIVDPLKKRIIVHDLENNTYVTEVYTFDDQIPVRIFGGDCIVDFHTIHMEIEYLYQDNEET